MTLAVNEVGIAFLAAASQRGDEFGPLSWRHEVAHVAGPARRGLELVIADAVFTYLHVDGDSLALHYRFVELDRATLSSDRLAAKLARYARLERYVPKGGHERGWRAHYPVFPGLLVVLADHAHPLLERRRDVVLSLCATDPEIERSAALAVSICRLDDLREHGPFAPIFLSASDPKTSVTGSAMRRPGRVVRRGGWSDGAATSVERGFVSLTELHRDGRRFDLGERAGIRFSVRLLELADDDAQRLRRRQLETVLWLVRRAHAEHNANAPGDRSAPAL